MLQMDWRQKSKAAEAGRLRRADFELIPKSRTVVKYKCDGVRWACRRLLTVLNSSSTLKHITPSNPNALFSNSTPDWLHLSPPAQNLQFVDLWFNTFYRLTAFFCDYSPYFSVGHCLPLAVNVLSFALILGTWAVPYFSHCCRSPATSTNSTLFRVTHSS